MKDVRPEISWKTGMEHNLGSEAKVGFAFGNGHIYPPCNGPEVYGSEIIKKAALKKCNLSHEKRWWLDGLSDRFEFTELVRFDFSFCISERNAEVLACTLARQFEHAVHHDAFAD